MKFKSLFSSILVIVISIQCIPADYEQLTIDCLPSQESHWADLMDLFEESNTPIQIRDSLALEAFVISSSAQGQFYGELIVQDRNESPTKGMRILTDATHIETLYPKGSWIRIELQGLYLQYKNNSFILGEALPSFGSIILGRIPSNSLKERLYRLCDAPPLSPFVVSVDQLNAQGLNTLVKLDSLQFKTTAMQLNYSTKEEETLRMLYDCKRDSIPIKTSNYANFADEPLPVLMGSIEAVLKKNSSGIYLEAARLEDFNFTLEACEPPPLFVTSNQLFISEWADPSNNTKARYIELYNASEEVIPLKGWSLVRYTNSNTHPGYRIAFEDEVILPNDVLVIASNAETFKLVYGFEADVYASTSSVAGSNGDDQAVLIDPFGVIIDQFGVIGEDGTGTSHDFEDGKALRKPSRTQSSAVFDATQWIIYNKRGGAGTIQQSLNAPEDYTPGVHSN